MIRIFLAGALLCALPACIVKSAVDTAADVVTAPVKVGSKAVDLATTSEEEKDAKFLRRMRKDCDRWKDEAKAARKAARKRGEPEPDIPPPNQYCV